MIPKLTRISQRVEETAADEKRIGLGIPPPPAMKSLEGYTADAA